MSIRIEIGERYVVTSDSFQFILHEKKRAESGKNAGQECAQVEQLSKRCSEAFGSYGR